MYHFYRQTNSLRTDLDFVCVCILPVTIMELHCNVQQFEENMAYGTLQNGCKVFAISPLGPQFKVDTYKLIHL